MAITVGGGFGWRVRSFHSINNIPMSALITTMGFYIIYRNQTYHIMGNDPSHYKDGDQPRTTYQVFAGPGFAYYKADRVGRCACGDVTARWLVSIKENGKWWCLECDAKQRDRFRDMYPTKNPAADTNF